MNSDIANNTTKIMIATIALLGLLIVVYFTYNQLFKLIKNYTKRTPGILDDYVLELFKIPVIGMVYWLFFKVFTHTYLANTAIYPILQHINTLLLIFSIAWLTIQFIKAGAYYLQGKLEIGEIDNLNARKNLTQINVFKNIVNSIIGIIALAFSLLTFDEARTIGLSLLTSAGVIGIIVGFAAQKSLGMILAGIQLAITQPIRLDDVVIVEEEWGRIEEITLTYVVVKIWDERRLILPVTWFLDKPFQNWTRTNADITGSIFLYVDYNFHVECIRKTLPEMLKNHSNWDGRLWNVQVTKTTEQYKEIRILLSSSNASKNWDLRADVREQLIDFINENYPDTFVKLRIRTT